MSEVHQKIEEFVKKHPVVLFMKGTPDMPQCGFSAATVECLNATGVEYQSVDVLSDPQVRQGIKEYSNWPTIPQLYIKGEFVGGCDIVRDMYSQGDLQEKLSNLS